MAELFDILVYDFTKADPIVDIPGLPTWTPVVSQSSTGLPDGVYELGFSVNGSFPDINDSVYLRYRVDGGDWYEISKEPSDITDTVGIYYAFPFIVTGGSVSIEVEVSKDAGGAQLNVDFGDAWVERKK